MSTVFWNHSYDREPKPLRPVGWNFANFVSALLQIAVIVAILL